MTTASASPPVACERIRGDLDRVNSILREELSSDRPEVAALCDHLTRFRGKMLRPALLVLSARATGGVRPIHYQLAAIVELFHLATLVHDDVLDEAVVRRQVVTINHGWGNQAAIMLGDWIISHAYHLASVVNHQWASLQISAVAHEVCEGELVQLSRRGRTDVSPEEYLQIVRGKTASLTGLAARFGAHFNDAAPSVQQACLDFGIDLGIAFQIVDDVLDLVGREDQAGKTLGTDLAKAKATLPLIHYLAKASPADARFAGDLLSAQPRGGPVSQTSAHAHATALASLRQAIIQAGCTESALHVAEGYVRSAEARLAALPPSEYKADLERLADSVPARCRQGGPRS